MMDLREKIARQAYEIFGPAQDDPWDAVLARRASLEMKDQYSHNQERCFALADRVIALFNEELDQVIDTDDLDKLQQRIAEALSPKPKMNLGHSISTGTVSPGTPQAR